MCKKCGLYIINGCFCVVPSLGLVKEIVDFLTLHFLFLESQYSFFDLKFLKYLKLFSNSSSSFSRLHIFALPSGINWILSWDGDFNNSISFLRATSLRTNYTFMLLLHLQAISMISTITLSTLCKCICDILSTLFTCVWIRIRKSDMRHAAFVTPCNTMK